MAGKLTPPAARAALFDVGNVASRPYYAFFQAVGTNIAELADRIDGITVASGGSGQVIGADSVSASGALQTGRVTLRLSGDDRAPGKTHFYGTGAAGTKGWFAVSDALAASSNVTLTVGTDGVTTFNLSAGVLASLALADSSVQPADLATVAITGAYSDLSGLPTLGTAAATASTDYATAAQGAKADTAVQSVVAGTNVTVDNTDPHNPVISASPGTATMPEGYIDGLKMQWVSGTALTVSSGAAYIEGSSAVLSAVSAIAKTGLSLSASTWYHVYFYSNAGTPDIEIVTTAPAVAYNGTAHSKTGDTSRRYIGSVRTNASGSIINFLHSLPLNDIKYQVTINDTALHVLANGVAVTSTAVSLATALPTTSRLATAFIENAATNGVIAFISNSDTGAAGSSNILSYLRASTVITCPLVANSSQQVLYAMQSAPTPSGLDIWITGYQYER